MSKWDDKITKAEKFLETSRVHGRKVYLRYSDDRDENRVTGGRVNLFYSNVNTIKESLFNSLPDADVSRLHKGDYEDDVARVASIMLQRALDYEVRCAKSFYEAVSSAILDRLVPGTGTAWVRFANPEQIFIDTVYWEDFVYEPVRSWSLVTWVARRHNLTKKEFISRYGKAALEQASEAKNSYDTVTPSEVTDGKFCVYELWDKITKAAYHIVKGVDEPLEITPDPYSLPDFFPCPRPLIANVTTAAFLPVTDYHLAQDQYNELDVIYSRMSLITTAVKVAGCYDAAAPEIGRMLKGAENVLIPVDDWAMHMENGGVKGLISWYPVEQVAAVYQALQGQYAHVKAALFEVTGMADIIRGASNQYETASAQEIKAQFASVRMNGYQRDVSLFVRDILNIMSGIMCKLYSDQKFMQIVGSFSEADQQYLQPAALLLRSGAMRMYKIDVSADSLTQADWSLEKESRMELMGYISQFLTSSIPAMEKTPELGPLLLSMMKFSVAGFKGAAEVEGILDQQLAMLVAKANQPQPPPPPSPEQQKAAAEREKMQMEAQLAQQQAQMEAQIKQAESAQKLNLERMQAEADMAVARQTAAAKAVADQEKYRLQRQALVDKLEFEQEMQKIKLQGQLASESIKAQESKDGTE